MGKFETMREVFDSLKDNSTIADKISLSEDMQVITVNFHELLEIVVDDDYLSFRSGEFDHHWHPSPGETYELLNELANGKKLFVLYRGGFRMAFNCFLVGLRLRQISNEKFEIEKSKLMKKWNVKSIFSGKEIFKR